MRKIEKAKAQVRVKVEHPFRVIMRQFGYTKVRFRGVVEKHCSDGKAFRVSNLWMARRFCSPAQKSCVRNEGNSCCGARAAAKMDEIGGRLDRF